MLILNFEVWICGLKDCSARFTCRVLSDEWISQCLAEVTSVAWEGYIGLYGCVEGGQGNHKRVIFVNLNAPNSCDFVEVWLRGSRLDVTSWHSNMIYLLWTPLTRASRWEVSVWDNAFAMECCVAKFWSPQRSHSSRQSQLASRH